MIVRNPVRKLLLCCLLVMLSASASQAGPRSAAASVRLPRRVFVLHAGLHTIFAHPNTSYHAYSIRWSLINRGVAPRDAIVMENPYPKASWSNMFPREALDIYLQSIIPTSKVSQDAYRRMHRQLVEQGVTASDEIIWIGHSAGGQMGLTIAHIAHSLEKYPELARETSPYRFGSVITLGAPVGSNLLPRETKLRHYFSPEDKVVRWTTLYGTFALRVLGYPVYVREVPPNLSSDSKVRIFLDIGHPYWNEERVVERILAEFEAAETPAWQDRERTVGMGPGLASLLAQAVELGWNLSLEDPPRDDTLP